MFENKKPHQNHHLKLSLDSHITLNLIDVVHLALHPSFVRPEGLFNIQAIGKPDIYGPDADVFNVYAENDGKHYLIEIEFQQNAVKAVNFYQNVLTLSPSETEWPELIRDIASKEVEVDGVLYRRALGGDEEIADLCEIPEKLDSREGDADCENQVMLFERTIEPGDFTEKLKVAIEVIESQQVAVIAFYVGFGLHPSTLSILGN